MGKEDLIESFNVLNISEEELSNLARHTGFMKTFQVFSFRTYLINLNKRQLTLTFNSDYERPDRFI